MFVQFLERNLLIFLPLSVDRVIPCFQILHSSFWSLHLNSDSCFSSFHPLTNACQTPFRSLQNIGSSFFSISRSLQSCFSSPFIDSSVSHKICIPYIRLCLSSHLLSLLFFLYLRHCYIPAMPQATSYHLFQKQLLVCLFLLIFPNFFSFRYLLAVILQWLLAFHRKCLFQELTEHVLPKHVKVHMCLCPHSFCLSLDTLPYGLPLRQLWEKKRHQL